MCYKITLQHPCYFASKRVAGFANQNFKGVSSFHLSIGAWYVSHQRGRNERSETERQLRSIHIWVLNPLECVCSLQVVSH